MEIFIVTWHDKDEGDCTMGAFSSLDKAKAACVQPQPEGWDEYVGCWRGDTDEGFYFIMRGKVDETLSAY